MQVDAPKVMGFPTPYDYFDLSVIYDPRTMHAEKTYNVPRVDDLEGILDKSLHCLQEFYGEDLVYFGVAGSFALGTQDGRSDVDTIAIVNNATGLPNGMPESVHVEVHTRDGLKSFLEHGDLLRTVLFDMSRPSFDKGVDDLRAVKPIREKFVPYLTKKIYFNFNAASIMRDIASKYKAAALDLLGRSDLAFEQLAGKSIDERLIEELIAKKPCEEAKKAYEMAINFLDKALDRLYFSSMGVAGLMALEETGKVQYPLYQIEYAKKKDEPWGLFLEVVSRRKRETRKRTNLITQTELNGLIATSKTYLSKVDNFKEQVVGEYLKSCGV